MIRLKAGLTQGVLGEKLVAGRFVRTTNPLTAQSTVSKVERGEIKGTFTYIVAVLEVCGADLATLEKTLREAQKVAIAALNAEVPGRASLEALLSLPTEKRETLVMAMTAYGIASERSRCESGSGEAISAIPESEPMVKGSTR